jgi:hypothetical protein
MLATKLGWGKKTSNAAKFRSLLHMQFAVDS